MTGLPPGGLEAGAGPEAADILATIWSVLPEARLVGGVVRDLLAGLPAADLDMATPTPPDGVMQRLRDAGLRVVPTGIEHGTVTAIVRARPVEITTLRRDVATDGRHATVAWSADWREDAARRDFTINAMSLDRSLAVFDYFGGQADLAAGRVRFVGQAGQRIEEDALRILRFFRFHARYGRGAPDRDAMVAIGARTACLDRLSAERVWSELSRILCGPRLAETLRLMTDRDVLPHLVPAPLTPDRLAGLVEAGLAADPVLRLAALCGADPRLVATRLRLSNADAARLAALRSPPVPAPGLSDPELLRLLADTPAAVLRDRAWLAHGAASAALGERLLALPVPVFPLAGRDLLALGVPPGPALGGLLKAVRDWWLAGGCVAGREACLAELGRRREAAQLG